MNLLKDMEKAQLNDTQSITARNTLKDLRGICSPEQQEEEENLRKLYIKWVELSQLDDSSVEKEKEMNQYFEVELNQLGIDEN